MQRPIERLKNLWILFIGIDFTSGPRNYDEMFRDRMIMVGDPKHCIEQIEEIRRHGHQLYYLHDELRHHGAKECPEFHGAVCQGSDAQI